MGAYDTTPVAQHWNEVYARASDSLPWELDYLPDEIETWARQLTMGARILDLGCGRGLHAIRLASQGFVVTGLDLSRIAINDAQRLAAAAGLTTLNFQMADITSYEPNRDELYDLVLDYSVFHHIDPTRHTAYLQTIVKCVQPRGRFGLVCYSEKDEEADNQSSRVGRFGNTIHHLPRATIENLFVNDFRLISYHETALGRKRNHPAHAFHFQRVVRA